MPDSHFTPGTVIYMFCDFTEPPKKKFLVVLSTDPLKLMFVINSNINDYYYRNKHLLKNQIRILASDYNFLTHDSYIDCNSAIDEYYEQKLNTMLACGTLEIKGKLNLDTVTEILDILPQSVTIETIDKKDIIKSLKEEYNL